jgi:integrase
MASITNRPNGHRWIQWKAADGARKTLRLGKCAQRVAEQHQRVVESILASAAAGLAVEQEVARFLADLPDELRERYVNCSLIPRSQGAKVKKLTLGQFLQSYFESRRSDVAESTWIFYEHTRKRLVEFFGGSRPIHDIHAADARDFKSWLENTNKRDKPKKSEPAKGLSLNTVRRRLGLCKQIFRQAVEDGLIPRNPFQAFRGAVRSNKERQHYVELADFQKVLDKAPDTYWKSLLLLGRLAGLRIPSEAAGLQWEHIDWDNRRLRIVDSKKTKRHEHRQLRYVPIPRMLEEQLRELRHRARPGAIHVFERLEGTSNLRTALLRFIQRAQLKPWPKLWQNLRASAATDFARTLPAHVAAAICGHTTQIAQEHYWTVADTDLESALANINEIVGKTAVQGRGEGEVKAEAASAGNGSQTVATETRPPTKNQGKQEIPGNGKGLNGRRGTRTPDIHFVRVAL